MYIKENQNGEGASECMYVRREREMQMMVTVSVRVKETPVLAVKARRRLGTPRNSFLKEGTGSQGSSS